MRRKWSLVGVGVLVLCVVGIVPVLAQGPGRNPIFATMEYVDQKVSELTAYVDQQVAALYAYVDEKIAEVGGGGGPGPDFDLPADGDWIVSAYLYSNPYGCIEPRLTIETRWTEGPLGTCSWHGQPLTLSRNIVTVDARAIVSKDGEVLGYGRGTCDFIQFQQLDHLPPVGESVDLDIWVFWMGTEKMMTISRTVAEPPNSPVGWNSCGADPEYGAAPLTVRFNWDVANDDPCEVLSYSVDFGDGTTAEGETLPDSHTYDAPGHYTMVANVTDHGGVSDVCDTSVDVE